MKRKENGLISKIMQLEFEKGMLKIDLKRSRTHKKDKKRNSKSILELKKLKKRIRGIEKELNDIYSGA